MEDSKGRPPAVLEVLNGGRSARAIDADLARIVRPADVEHQLSRLLYGWKVHFAPKIDLAHDIVRPCKIRRTRRILDRSNVTRLIPLVRSNGDEPLSVIQQQPR